MSIAKTPPATQPLVTQLVHLTQLMTRGAESPGEADEFYGLLDQTLSLPPEQESQVTSAAMETLLQLGDTAAAEYLVEELELDSELWYARDNEGRRRACLLFALPVVVCSGDTLQQHAQDDELFSELHDVLTEADIIDNAADFGLVPRLFSYAELMAAPYGKIRSLTRYFAQQVFDGAQRLQLPMDYEPVSLEGSSCSPYVDLFFVLGVASTRESELDRIFPELAEERDPLQSGMAFSGDEEGSAIVLSVNGDVDNGEPWEKPFCQAFDDAFGCILGSLTTLPPDGFAEDLRRGQALAREVGLLRMFEAQGRELPSEPGAGDQPGTGPGYARLSPLLEQDGERFVEVSCVWAPDEPAVETVRWPVLLHETDESALQSLVECLEDAGISQELTVTRPLAHRGSFLKH